jgi:hypothetical protein
VGCRAFLKDAGCNQIGPARVLPGVGCVQWKSVATGNARREFAFVFLLAVAGIAAVLVVAFAPWYGAVAPS